MIKPDINKYMEYVRTKGRQGDRTVEILKENTSFLEALHSEVGSELLKDLCSMHEQLLNKIAKFEATDTERMEYKVVYDLMCKWGEHISAYYKAIETINKEADKVHKMV